MKTRIVWLLNFLASHSRVISTWARQEIDARIVITMSLLLRITLLLFALNLLSTCAAFGSYSGKGYGSGKYGAKPSNNPMLPEGAAADVPGQSVARRGLGLSAWGIIVIILAVILGGMGFYYFSMCYPILCKKERKYGIIHVDTA